MDRNRLSDLLYYETIQMASNPLHIPPLFHGTNKRSLYYSKEEREQLSVACGKIIKYLLKAYKEQHHPTDPEQRKILGELIYNRFRDAYNIASGRAMNLSLYQYHDVYVFLEPKKACNYARRAVVLGETGYTTYWLHEGIKRLGISLPKQTTEEKEAFALFYHYKNNEIYDPVILMFSGLQIGDLQTESGQSISEDKLKFNLSMFHGIYRIVKPDFDFQKCEYLSVVEALSIQDYVQENKEQVLEKLSNYDLLKKDIVEKCFNKKLNEILDKCTEKAEFPEWLKSE